MYIKGSHDGFSTGVRQTKEIFSWIKLVNGEILQK